METNKTKSAPRAHFFLLFLTVLLFFNMSLIKLFPLTGFPRRFDQGESPDDVTEEVCAGMAEVRRRQTYAAVDRNTGRRQAVKCVRQSHQAVPIV